MSPLLTVFVFALVLTGCAVRGPQTYRLVPQGRARVVVPPGTAMADVSLGTVTTKGGGAHPCANGEGAITVAQRGGKLRLSVSREALLARPPGWLRQWTAESEASGCLPAGADFDLRVLESLPLDPAAAYRLLHGESLAAGYVELGPENRLQTQAPIMKSGKPLDPNAVEIASVTGTDRVLDVDVRAPDEAIGVETAWYALRPRADGAGMRIVWLSAERNVNGTKAASAAPSLQYFQFVPAIGFYRLIYKADAAGKGSITEIVVGAPDRVELALRTRLVLDDFATCQVSNPSLCAVIPRHVALNPLVAVMVNGQETRIGIRGSVRSAIRQGGGPQRAEDLLPVLMVRKPYGGKLVAVVFDRSSSAILDMTLLGGESIDWK